MSFNNEVKNELSNIQPIPRHCRMAEFAGFLIYLGKKDIDKTDYTVIKSLTDSFSDLDEFKKFKLGTGADGGYVLRDRSIVDRSCCKRCFLRGAFLASGQISSPSSEYHMEIVSDSEENAKLLASCINAFDLDAKITERRGKFVTYLKEAAEISDMLSIIEAHVSMMKFENERILKSVRNNVNRRVNCETANLVKTVGASKRQVEDIEFILANGGEEKLEQGLKDIARIRMENPEKSLSEIGKLCTPKLGRSGVNHRFTKIHEIAEELRDQRAQKS